VELHYSSVVDDISLTIDYLIFNGDFATLYNCPLNPLIISYFIFSFSIQISSLEAVECLSMFHIKVNMDLLVVSPSIPDHNIDMKYFKGNSKQKLMQTRPCLPIRNSNLCGFLN
jgi:hypothetical protein